MINIRRIIREKGDGRRQLAFDEAVTWLHVQRMEINLHSRTDIEFSNYLTMTSESNDRSVKDALVNCVMFLQQRNSTEVTRRFIDELDAAVGCASGRDNQVYFALLSADPRSLFSQSKPIAVLPPMHSQERVTYIDEGEATPNELPKHSLARVHAIVNLRNYRY